MAGKIVRHDRECKQCGISPITGTKFCSMDCCRLHRYRASGSRPREIVNAERREAAMRTCYVCGDRYLNNTSSKGYCCSRKCGDVLIRWRGEQIRAHTQAKRELAKWTNYIAPGFNNRISVLRRWRARAEAPCAQCGNQVGWARTRTTPATFCSTPCKQAGPAFRESKKAQRKKRKAAQRAVTVETVSPLKVFMRDGWLCHLCGGKTDKGKRGTMHPNAPELDHILPLAKGGEHSYANTACAHKRCNAAKSDRIIGQPSLLAA